MWFIRKHFFLKFFRPWNFSKFVKNHCMERFYFFPFTQIIFIGKIVLLVFLGKLWPKMGFVRFFLYLVNTWKAGWVKLVQQNSFLGYMGLKVPQNGPRWGFWVSVLIGAWWYVSNFFCMKLQRHECLKLPQTVVFFEKNCFEFLWMKPP